MSYSHWQPSKVILTLTAFQWPHIDRLQWYPHIDSLSVTSSYLHTFDDLTLTSLRNPHINRLSMTSLYWQLSTDILLLIAFNDILISTAFQWRPQVDSLSMTSSPQHPSTDILTSTSFHWHPHFNILPLTSSPQQPSTDILTSAVFQWHPPHWQPFSDFSLQVFRWSHCVLTTYFHVTTVSEQELANIQLCHYYRW